jgi:hypothetical protein
MRWISPKCLGRLTWYLLMSDLPSSLHQLSFSRRSLAKQNHRQTALRPICDPSTATRSVVTVLT